MNYTKEDLELCPNLALEYPRVMMVSDEPITEENPGIKRVVWCYNPRLRYPYRTYNSNIQTIYDINKYKIIGDKRPTDTDTDTEATCREDVGWGFCFAKDYIESTVELTLVDIAKKFNVNVKNIKIKNYYIHSIRSKYNSLIYNVKHLVKLKNK